jgi:hypothetical protein
MYLSLERRSAKSPRRIAVPIDPVPVQYDSAIERQRSPQSDQAHLRPSESSPDTPRIRATALSASPPTCQCIHAASVGDKSELDRHHHRFGRYAARLRKVNILISENVHARCCNTLCRWRMSVTWRRHYAYHEISANHGAFFIEEESGL